MKRFRCGKCGEEFVGRLEICPKCGVELHYLDQEVVKENKVAKTSPKFYYEDEDVIKTGIIDDIPETKSETVKETPAAIDKRVQRQFSGESYFDGHTIQLFLWRLLGFFLCVITLSIAFPWTMCMVYRWEAKHTVINGYRLHFDGKGGQLFGRYLLWLLITILTCGVFLIFLANKIKKWKIKHTVFLDTVQNN